MILLPVLIVVVLLARDKPFTRLVRLFSVVLMLQVETSFASADPDSLFRQGLEAYRSGDFGGAASAFRRSSSVRPASGTLQNLGNTEWQRDRVGASILAWEQAA